MSSDIARLVRLASEKYLFCRDKFRAVEQAMDDLDWRDEETCIDDVIELMTETLKAQKQGNKDQQALKKQESQWKWSMRAPPAGAPENEWKPKFCVDDKDSVEWEEIMNRVSKIDDRYIEMSRCNGLRGRVHN